MIERKGEQGGIAKRRRHAKEQGGRREQIPKFQHMRHCKIGRGKHNYNRLKEVVRYIKLHMIRILSQTARLSLRDWKISITA